MMSDADKLAALTKLGSMVDASLIHEEQLSESFWQGLSSEEQLWAFCAIIRRLSQANLVDRKSFRGVLYDTFGWGPEAYGPAQLAGYLTLHNSLYSDADIEELILKVFDSVDVDNKDQLQTAVIESLYKNVY